VVAKLGEVVVQLLNTRFVRNGRVRVWGASWRFGGILAARTMHLVELLGQRVVRLHFVVGDRPGGRVPVIMHKLSEVLFA
jgi:hypothetical protein